MSQKTYKASCHCRQVRYEADLDLTAGSSRCNCSICARTRQWGITVKPAQFRLLTGEESLRNYQFGSMTQNHYFCRVCGVHVFGQGYVEQIGGDYYSVNIACLEEVSPTELAAIPVRYMDGRHNKWLQTPAETRYL